MNEINKNIQKQFSCKPTNKKLKVYQKKLKVTEKLVEKINKYVVPFIFIQTVIKFCSMQYQ